MHIRKQKMALFRIALSFILFSTLSLAAQSALSAADVKRPTLNGDVAYAEPITFDYNQDGTLNSIQLWATFEIKPAVGTKGESGYLPEEGYLRRFMKDLSLGMPVIGYSQFNMLPDNPLGDEVVASDIQLNGNSITFMSGDLHYTVVDGGAGLSKDTITVNDGIREYPVSLFDGDITLSNTRNKGENKR